MKEEFKEVLLNEYQKRGLSVTLRTVEKNIREVEQILNNSDRRGVLYDMKDDIPNVAKDEILKRTFVIKERIKIIAEKFSLRKKYKKIDSEVLAKLSLCWEILEDTKAIKLRRYGDISEGLEDVLDPQLNVIIELILGIDHLLRGGQK